MAATSKKTSPLEGWVTVSEAARRVQAEGLAPSMSHTWLTQLAERDPEFPVPRSEWHKVGRSFLLPWEPIKKYFEKRAAKEGADRLLPDPDMITVIVENTRGTARFHSPQDPRMSGTVRRVANNQHQAETDPDESGKTVTADGSRRESAVRALADKLELRVRLQEPKPANVVLHAERGNYWFESPDDATFLGTVSFIDVHCYRAATEKVKGKKQISADATRPEAAVRALAGKLGLQVLNLEVEKAGAPDPISSAGER